MNQADYEAAREAHRARMRPWVDARHARRLRGESHPVWDFLFEYYSFKPGQLTRYSPGLGVTVVADPRELDWAECYRECDAGVALDAAAFPARRSSYLQWAVEFLRAVAAREPNFGCFGLHEWAMVYRSPPRHGLPLRLGVAGTDAVVESARICCTHYDAYRFFAPDARPRNKIALARADQTAHDQPGCVHANMDLYKFAYKVAPLVSSTTLGDSFELAAAARELDMRASPYDLRPCGFEAIPIETRAGRDEYARRQRELSVRASQIRTMLLAEYEKLLNCVTPIRDAPGNVMGQHSTTAI